VARVPRTPPAPGGGRQATTLLCLAGVSGMCLHVAWVPRTPPGPIGGRQSTTLSALFWCQWDEFLLVAWVLRTPQPRWGPAVINLALPLMYHRSVSLLYYFGPPARFLTDTLGGGDPSPNLSFKFHTFSGPVAPIHSQPSGAIGAQAPCSHTIRWGFLTLFILFIPTPLVHSRGGRGTGHALPHPPHPLLFPHLGVRGGGPVNQGPLSFLIMCGAGPPDPPCPHWGAGSQQLCSASD